MYYVGIDFGTTNSSISVIDENQVELTDLIKIKPREIEGGYTTSEGERVLLRTLLYFSSQGNVTAEQTMAALEPTRTLTSLKRKIINNPSFSFTIDGKIYRAPELISLFIDDLLKRCKISVKEIKRLVLSVPVHYDEQMKSTMLSACNLLGIETDKVWFVDEPVAIIWFYKGQLEKQKELLEKNSLIFDFGGGTLDLAIIKPTDTIEGNSSSYEILKQWDNDEEQVHHNKTRILAKEGVIVGGDDLDDIIIRCIVEQGKEQGNLVCEKLDLSLYEDKNRLAVFRDKEVYKRIKPLAEQIKISLSKQENVELTIPPLLPKVDRTGVRLSLTRVEFEERAEKIWKSIEDGISNLEKQLKTKHDMHLGDIHTVLLSGGSSLIPHIHDILESKFPNARVQLDSDLQTSICCGSARYSYQDGGIVVDSGEVIDIVNAAYGIWSHHDRETIVMIDEQDSIPARKERRVGTTKPFQDAIEIIPMERKGGKFKPLTKNNQKVFFKLPIKPIKESGDYNRIKLSYVIDTNQKLTISAFDNYFRRPIDVKEIRLTD